MVGWVGLARQVGRIEVIWGVGYFCFYSWTPADNKIDNGKTLNLVAFIGQTVEYADPS